MSITWADLVGPLVLFAVAFAAIWFLGWRARRKIQRVEEKRQEKDSLKEGRKMVAQTFLILKIEEDLKEADSRSRPLLEALRKIVDQHTIDDDSLRAIAEIYRYRRGFKQEWIGE